MLEQTGRLLILLITVGIVAAIMILIVNTTGNSTGVSTNTQFNEFKPDQGAGIGQPPPKHGFEGARNAPVGMAAIELLKNFVIMAIITGIVLITRKIYAKLKPRRSANEILD